MFDGLCEACDVYPSNIVDVQLDCGDSGRVYLSAGLIYSSPDGRVEANTLIARLQVRLLSQDSLSILVHNTLVFLSERCAPQFNDATTSACVQEFNTVITTTTAVTSPPTTVTETTATTTSPTTETTHTTTMETTTDATTTMETTTMETTDTTTSPTTETTYAETTTTAEPSSPMTETLGTTTSSCLPVTSRNTALNVVGVFFEGLVTGVAVTTALFIAIIIW